MKLRVTTYFVQFYLFIVKLHFYLFSLCESPQISSFVDTQFFVQYYYPFTKSGSIYFSKNRKTRDYLLFFGSLSLLLCVPVSLINF